MSKSFYISDLHFSHFNAISFDNRPWQTVEEMNEAIVNIWNSRVTDDDDVWILGDISWTNPYNTRVLMARLKGKKHWIIGNHDHKIARNEEALNIKMPMYNVGIMVDYMEWGPKTLDQILEANQ